MNWSGYIDIYCERLEPGFWAEPVNALTNAAFIVAAMVVWPLVGRTGRFLALLVALVGIGSFAYHSTATIWGSALDVGVIAIFSSTYVYLATRDMLELPHAWLAPILFVPYLAGTTMIFAQIPVLQISNTYWALALLIAIYGWLLRDSSSGSGMFLAAGFLALSITMRSVDIPLCEAFPLGTHFLWHILNGITLGWLILVYDRHTRALEPSLEGR